MKNRAKRYAVRMRSMASGMACGSYFADKERFRYRFLEKRKPHTYFYSTREGIRQPGRKTPDKSIYQTRRKNNVSDMARHWKLDFIFYDREVSA